MVLEKKRSELVWDPLKYSWCFFGPHGVGKTTLASLMGNPYFIATTRQHRFQKILKSECYTYEALVRTVDELVARRHNHDVVVMDTVLGAWEACTDYYCKKVGWDTISDGHKGAGYDKVKGLFRPLISKLVNSGLGLVFIAHDNTKEDEYLGKKKHKVVPHFIKTVRDVVLTNVDIMGFMFVKEVMDGNRMVPKRHITFTPTEEIDVKDHSGLLCTGRPIILEPVQEAWNNIAKVFNDQKKKEGET